MDGGDFIVAILKWRQKLVHMEAWVQSLKPPKNRDLANFAEIETMILRGIDGFENASIVIFPMPIFLFISNYHFVFCFVLFYLFFFLHLHSHKSLLDIS